MLSSRMSSMDQYWVYCVQVTDGHIRTDITTRSKNNAREWQSLEAQGTKLSLLDVHLSVDEARKSLMCRVF